MLLGHHAMGSSQVLRISLLIFALCFFCEEVSGERHRNKHGRHRNNSHAPQRELVEFRPARREPEILMMAKDQDLREKGKICIGTNGRMSVPSNRDHHYRNLRDRFTNCTYVDGNLELTWLQDDNLDLSFLQYIREVTGYVLISHVDIRRIVLPSLQIIRGRTLFKMNVREEEFALLVTLSKLYSLELPALRDVLKGSVGLFNNYNLCHIRTINWKEIITDPAGQYVYVYNFTSPERECSSCHKDCEAGCWGEGKENCQKFSKENCSPQCYQGRCFGPNPRECCHLFCAGGCVGPKQSDCIACRNFYDDGVCKQECPQMQIYNPITYSWEVSPTGKYAYGATCVKNCPEHLLKDNGACVRTCPPQKKAVNGECVPCDGPCPKTCRGDTLVHSGNIDSFKECTVIEGYLQILENSFRGFQHIFPNYTFGERFVKMHPDRLEAFSTLKEITGYLNIQAYHPDFKNLSYFRNLEVIEGRTVYEYFSSLYIVKTSLQSLELRSLNKISAGTVTILENEHLCFAEQINWDKIRKNFDHSLMLSNNADHEKCTKLGLICDDQCSSDGCWGTGADKCLSCTHFQLHNLCLQNCSVLPGTYRAGTRECKRCHEECGFSCHGPGPDNCTSCKHFKDGPFCVSECPSNKYEENGICKACHSTCVDGCTGPKNTVEIGGCNSCDLAIMTENATIERCLNKTEVCPEQYFLEWVAPHEQESLKHLAGKAVCRKCHHRCKKCSSYGFHESVCQECTSYKKGEQCEDECPTDHFPDNTTQKCIPCDTECRGCRGPGPDNCIICQNFKIYHEEINNSSFTCVFACPQEMPYRTFPDNGDAYCSDKEFTSMQLTSMGVNKIYMYVGATVFVIVFAIAVIFLAMWRRKVKNKEEALKMTMAMTGLEDERLTQPKVTPNVAKLRIVKETEIRKGAMLGRGAFGAVYRGVWVPEGESTKIPVAIKVLHEDTGCNSNRSKEFLSEAVIMASVEHVNLLQLLAVCMTSQMMLITQLMPLGCLLDFVKKNKDKVGSKTLLNWCTQIARGMAYLEDKRLVHRDLAARNVLVQTPDRVKITDFGLAKLLDINEEEYKADGGKMPIKWLALECIQHRIFTHKSDVWAFGVTVWEILTFGGRPYDNVPVTEVPELLEKGERLPQPAIASIDVYVIMIKCWMLDAECRPSFKELAEEFAKMSKDPGRYLVLPGVSYPRGPSHDMRDGRENMRHGVAALESNEALPEAEMKCRRSPLHAGTPDPFGWINPSHINSDGSSQYQNNLNQKLLRYSQNHGLDSASLQTTQTDVSSIKYCGDSFKMNDDGSDEYDSGRSQAHVGTLKLDLPVDEEDYLVPSPQQNQGASTYVDLIDSKNLEGAGANSRSLSDFYKTSMDNPEYLMSNDVITQTVGLPIVSKFVQPRPSSSVGHSNFASVQQPHRNCEEESDHEYYNDFDRLERELQPLQKTKEGSIV